MTPRPGREFPREDFSLTLSLCQTFSECPKLRKLVYIMCGNGGLHLRFSQAKIKNKINFKNSAKAGDGFILKKQAWTRISEDLNWMLRLSFTLNENNEH